MSGTRLVRFFQKFELKLSRFLRKFLSVEGGLGLSWMLPKCSDC